jgi:hypothetical protein
MINIIEYAQIDADRFEQALNPSGYFPQEKLEAKLPPLETHSRVYLERLYNKLELHQPKQVLITSLQYDRLIALVSLASSVAISFFASYPVNILGGLCALSFALYKASSFFSHDLDSKATLEKVQKQIAKWSFQKLTETFSFEDILDYDLLKQLTAFYTSFQKVQVYADLKDLIELKQKTSKDLYLQRTSMIQHPLEMFPNAYYSLNSDYQAMLTYEKKMEDLMEQRYKKIAEGAFLKEDL